MKARERNRVAGLRANGDATALGKIADTQLASIIHPLPTKKSGTIKKMDAKQSVPRGRQKQVMRLISRWEFRGSTKSGRKPNQMSHWSSSRTDRSRARFGSGAARKSDGDQLL